MARAPRLLGATTGPHLHFELWRDGRPRDPVEELDHGPRQPGPVAARDAAAEEP